MADGHVLHSASVEKFLNSFGCHGQLLSFTSLIIDPLRFVGNRVDARFTPRPEPDAASVLFLQARGELNRFPPARSHRTMRPGI